MNVMGIVVGLKEVEGFFGKKFDILYGDLYCGEENWEFVEWRLMLDLI